MTNDYHTFVIPVMGTGHTADSPIRIAALGISSVISLVDDWLLEELRGHYAAKYALPFQPIGRQAEDGRARRITAYLDLVDEIVEQQMAALRALPLGPNNAKARYFRLLPDASPLKAAYQRLQSLPAGAERDRLAAELAARMAPGSIDVNIMVKVDRVNYDRGGAPLDDTFRDAQAALRGYAPSRLRSGLVLSAGINQPLISYMTQFPDFYRGPDGLPKKRIIVKVSDFRSARIQGRYLARKGLEVAEYRLESGLNCGGHAFATAGLLMPTILAEFADKRDELAASTLPDIRSYYAERGWELPRAAVDHRPLFTVAGGIGTPGEAQRLHQAYGADQTAWGTPFLLVPEATCVDATTRDQLARATAADLWPSDASPLGIPFHNLRGSGSERKRLARVAAGTPGSPCPKGHAVLDCEFTERPICIASRQYQRLKLAQLEELDLPAQEKERRRALITARDCICDHLGNGVRIALGIAEEQDAPQAICPGPNLAWFDRTYTLEEMVDQIYGRGPSLVPAERPHMFAQELALYVDFYAKLVESASSTPQERQYVAKYAAQLEEGMATLEALAAGPAYGDENLASLGPCVAAQRTRLAELAARVG